VPALKAIKVFFTTGKRDKTTTGRGEKKRGRPARGLLLTKKRSPVRRGKAETALTVMGERRQKILLQT